MTILPQILTELPTRVKEPAAEGESVKQMLPQELQPAHSRSLLGITPSVPWKYRLLALLSSSSLKLLLTPVVMLYQLLHDDQLSALSSPSQR